MAATNNRIGFIGLGIMGRPMARNLVKAGFELVIYNRSRDDMELLLAESSAFSSADSVRVVVEQCEIVITMLPDSGDVLSVVLGPEGLISGIDGNSLLVDMSTIAPAAAIQVHEAVAAKGGQSLDAPVSGGEQGAINATLSIMVGGEEAALDRAMPLFEAMGKTIVHVGEAGAGQVVKACNQVMVAVNYAALSEALILGAAAGVEPEKILQVLGGGLANSRVMELRGSTMIKGTFNPGFRVDLHRKDLNIALTTGKEVGAPLPVTALVDQLFQALAAAGRGDLDHSALLTIYEDLAGRKISG